ncbi:hypothetical protein, partial [Pedosphaera parvula]
MIEPFTPRCGSGFIGSVRKKRIMLVALVLLVLGGGLWFSMRREETILIHGTLPAKDLAEIKSIVRADMLRNVFPSFSWHNVHYLPAVASVTFRSRIFEIHCFGSNAVIVTTGVDPGKPNKLWSNTEA